MRNLMIFLFLLFPLMASATDVQIRGNKNPELEIKYGVYYEASRNSPLCKQLVPVTDYAGPFKMPGLASETRGFEKKSVAQEGTIEYAFSFADQANRYCRFKVNEIIATVTHVKSGHSVEIRGINTLNEDANGVRQVNCSLIGENKDLLSCLDDSAHRSTMNSNQELKVDFNFTP